MPPSSPKPQAAIVFFSGSQPMMPLVSIFSFADLYDVAGMFDELAAEHPSISAFSFVTT